MVLYLDNLAIRRWTGNTKDFARINPWMPGHQAVGFAGFPTVILKPGEADRLVAGHPWIYAGEILRVTRPPADGEIVQVKDHRQRFLGIGFFNSKSKIHVRVLASERIEVDEGFFEGRIRAALEV